jgi:hypothetical protein
MTAGPYYDADAIERLAREIHENDGADAGASSHWREMHATFRYRDGALEGLRGFGTHTPRTRWLESLAHRVFQRRWRRMGRAFPDYPRMKRIAEQVARRQGRIVDLDVLRQALTLAYLEARVPAAFAAGETIVVIGDGYGTFSSIALAAFEDVRVVAVNLVKTLLVDLLYVRKGVPEALHALVADERSMAQALDNSEVRLIAVRAGDSALLARVPAALAVNVASMQEMDPGVIAGYFSVLRAMPKPVTFYCCNREEKILPDATVVRFADYPWSPGDTVLDDALCPWHQQYYSAHPPFFHAYDGPIRHRLAVLARG